MLVISGRFAAERALKPGRQSFGRMPAPSRAWRNTYTAEPPQDGSRMAELRRAGSVNTVYVGYHIPSVLHPDFAPLRFLPRAGGISFQPDAPRPCGTECRCQRFGDAGQHAGSGSWRFSAPPRRRMDRRKPCARNCWRSWSVRLTHLSRKPRCCGKGQPHSAAWMHCFVPRRISRCKSATGRQEATGACSSCTVPVCNMFRRKTSTVWHGIISGHRTARWSSWSRKRQPDRVVIPYVSSLPDSPFRNGRKASADLSRRTFRCLAVGG